MDGVHLGAPRAPPHIHAPAPLAGTAGAAHGGTAQRLAELDATTPLRRASGECVWYRARLEMALSLDHVGRSDPVPGITLLSLRAPRHPERFLRKSCPSPCQSLSFYVAARITWGKRIDYHKFVKSCAPGAIITAHDSRITRVMGEISHEFALLLLLLCTVSVYASAEQSGLPGRRFMTMRVRDARTDGHGGAVAH